MSFLFSVLITLRLLRIGVVDSMRIFETETIANRTPFFAQALGDAL